jgi:hypothetical protein
LKPSIPGVNQSPAVEILGSGPKLKEQQPQIPANYAYVREIAVIPFSQASLQRRKQVPGPGPEIRDKTIKSTVFI